MEISWCNRQFSIEKFTEDALRGLDLTMEGDKLRANRNEKKLALAAIPVGTNHADWGRKSVSAVLPPGYASHLQHVQGLDLLGVRD